MSKLNDIARQLLHCGEVHVVIGYGEGFNGRIRPTFAFTDNEADKLLFDNRCRQNLASYLCKKEIVSHGKPAIVANIHTLRGIIRLAAEKQIADGNVIAIVMTSEGDVRELHKLEDMENFLSGTPLQLNETDRIMLDKLNSMTVSDRWKFWQEEIGNCIRCYACRQACPLCYCTQCTVEINCPQWIPVAPYKMSNMEWHIMRAMHLSGRCVECGQCGAACPVNIPIHLLPVRLAEEIKERYGTVSGTKREEICEMSSFLPEDSENFIG
ncbi:MAG: 4Fe-4S dicluster domain-containing protein [Dysgonamonadaceae bacterium]|jgi:ferredoxin|nr:4Fe-4S dicluster domain-containing protein [Dysgonamonadaceae bacterium]